MVARLPGTAGGAAPCSIEGIAAVVQNGSTYTYFNNRPVEMAEGSALDSGTTRLRMGNTTKITTAQAAMAIQPAGP